MQQQISAADARAAVESGCRWNDDPALTADDITRIVDGARRVDSEGRSVTDDAWTETYDVDAALMEAWRLKAGVAAGRFDVNVDDANLHRSQVVKHCLTMAATHARRVVGVARTRREPRGSTWWERQP